MASKGYILIMIACLPVILGQSPASSPAASPTFTAAETKACKDASNHTECEELLKNVGGDYLKVLIGNLEALKAQLPQMAISINKTLLNFTGDEEFRTCLIDTRDSYEFLTDNIERSLKNLKTKGLFLSEWSVMQEQHAFDDVRRCFEHHPDYRFDIVEKDAQAVEKIFRFLTYIDSVINPVSENYKSDEDMVIYGDTMGK